VLKINNLIAEDPDVEMLISQSIRKPLGELYINERFNEANELKKVDLEYYMDALTLAARHVQDKLNLW